MKNTNTNVEHNINIQGTTLSIDSRRALPLRSRNRNMDNYFT